MKQVEEEAAVEPGSVIRTDGWTGYNQISSHGYIHEVVTDAATYKTIKKSVRGRKTIHHNIACLLQLKGDTQIKIKHPNWLDFELSIY